MTSILKYTWFEMLKLADVMLQMSQRAGKLPVRVCGWVGRRPSDRRVSQAGRLCPGHRLPGLSQLYRQPMSEPV